MAAVPPVITSSARANFARITMLVFDVGTDITAQAVLEHLPLTETLDQALEAKRGRIESLFQRVINQAQMQVLYPPSGDPVDVRDIDLTLWVVLLCMSDRRLEIHASGSQIAKVR